MASRPRWRTVVTVILLVVMLVPAFRDDDGLPLSSYPMYARPRASAVEFIVPVALDASGSELPLRTETIADTSDPLIAEAFLRDEVRAGRTESLCQQIAERTAGDVTAIEIRSERHEVVDRVLGDPSVVETTTLASCSAP